MKLASTALALFMGLGLIGPALAEDTPPPPSEEKPQPASPDAGTPEEASAEAKPAETPAEAKPAAAEPAKALSPCAQSYAPLAESYKKAYEDMQKWIAKIDSETGTAGAKVTQLQEQIQKNEAEITKAKLDNDDKRVKDLTKETKKLWDEVETVKKSLAQACSGYLKEASTLVKQYSAETSKALDAVNAGMK